MVACGVVPVFCLRIWCPADMIGVRTRLGVTMEHSGNLRGVDLEVRASSGRELRTDRPG
jgi:hypothetical protein